MTIIENLSPRSLRAPESGIVEVVNYARGREGLIPLWVGEGDLPTPEFIANAASQALLRGETFYTWQRGIPELRAALSRYYARRFGATLPAEHFYVVGSGMQAITLAIQALVSPGDDMIYLTPAWPNFAAAAALSGANPIAVTLDFTGGTLAGRSRPCRGGDHAEDTRALHQHAVEPDRLDGVARGPEEPSYHRAPP